MPACPSHCQPKYCYTKSYIGNTLYWTEGHVHSGYEGTVFRPKVLVARLYRHPEGNFFVLLRENIGLSGSGRRDLLSARL